MPLSLYRPSQTDPTAPPDAGSGPADQAPSSSTRRRGATALEYVFVASLIIVVAFSAVNYFGQQTKASLEQTSNAIQKADDTSGP
jgi:Flp pilus assembly pilin Flp